MFAPQNYLDLAHCPHSQIFDGLECVWDALPRIAPYLKERIQPANHAIIEGVAHIGPCVYLGEGTIVEAGATIKGPAWIGTNCRIRTGAYIRENVILGNGVTAGNSCEFKNCLVCDNAEIPHFNYVGDSLLGYKAHLGAGVILSNVRLDRENVVVHLPDGTFMETGLRKFGAVLGDLAEIGCNSVLSPGSIIGRRSIVYPCTSWSGILLENKIAKVRTQVSISSRRS